MGETGELYNERYLHKGDYREMIEIGIQWVMRYMGHPRYFHKMFRMSVEIFMTLYDLLVSTNGLTSNNNVSSIESSATFLWIIGGPQLFSQAENHFTRSLWTVHMKFYEVLKCMRKLGKDNIIPRYSTFSTDHARVRENRFLPYFKCAIGAIYGSHMKVVIPMDEVVNHTYKVTDIHLRMC
jgi:hypothetical protein